MIETKLPGEFVLDYDKLYIIPTDEKYAAYYGDTQYVFNNSEIEELCDAINSIGCMSFQLSKEDLLSLLEQVNKENKQ